MLKSSLPVVIDILSFVIYTTSLLMVIYIFDWQAPDVHELLLHLTVAFERTDLESRDFLFVLDFTLCGWCLFFVLRVRGCYFLYDSKCDIFRH